MAEEYFVRNRNKNPLTNIKEENQNTKRETEYQYQTGTDSIHQETYVTSKETQEKIELEPESKEKYEFEIPEDNSYVVNDIPEKDYTVDDLEDETVSSGVEEKSYEIQNGEICLAIADLEENGIAFCACCSNGVEFRKLESKVHHLDAEREMQQQEKGKSSRKPITKDYDRAG